MSASDELENKLYLDQPARESNIRMVHVSDAGGAALTQVRLADERWARRLKQKQLSEGRFYTRDV